MSRLMLILLSLSLTLAAAAQSRPLVSDEILAQIKDEHPNPLPAYLTPEERLLPLSQPTRSGPPTGVVDTPAEYEPCDGLIISWQGYATIQTQLVVGVTTGDPAARVWIVVDSSSEQASVTSTLTAAGADLSRVVFITRATNSVWMRDYGPRFIFEDGMRAIVDHTYNRPRPLDDAFPQYLGPLWGETVYNIPLTHGGGNFHLFRNNDAFMTSLIQTENPGLTAQQIKDYFLQYQGLNVTIYPGFPTSFDSTQHIDMWMMPLGDYKVIIGQYAPSTGTPYTITENAVADLTSRGYTVYRTPGWNSGGTHYTYTNAVILNQQVFISKFGGSYTTQDAQALAVYQTALPGYTIRQIDNASIITAAGAMHCIVMHVPTVSLGPTPVVRVTEPNGGGVWTIGTPCEVRWSATDDVGVQSIDVYLSTDGGATWPMTVATGEANDGVLAWTVPALPTTHARIKVVATDTDGNAGADVSDADFTITANGPRVIHAFPLDTNPGWTTQGQWAWGRPTGGGGQYGSPDPTGGHTGLNVYGYNLNGDYAASIPEYHLTSLPLDCRNHTQVKLRFWRWLGVESPTYDHAYVRVSNNGTAWTTVWQNTAQVADSAWTPMELDISSVANNQATVYLRWTMGTTDSSWQFCGWNIDDIEIVAVPTLTPGDLDCSGAVDFDDIDPFVLALTGPEAYAAQYPNCPWLNGDCDGNGTVDFDDIDPFVALLGG